jgi:hypothetical protein
MLTIRDEPTTLSGHYLVLSSLESVQDGKKIRKGTVCLMLYYFFFVVQRALQLSYVTLFLSGGVVLIYYLIN